MIVGLENSHSDVPLRLICSSNILKSRILKLTRNVARVEQDRSAFKYYRQEAPREGLFAGRRTILKPILTKN